MVGFGRVVSVMIALTCGMTVLATGGGSRFSHAAEYVLSDLGGRSVANEGLQSREIPPRSPSARPAPLSFDAALAADRSVLIDVESGDTVGEGAGWSSSETTDQGGASPHHSVGKDVNKRGLLACLLDRPESCWTVRAESILMWRDSPESRPLFSTVLPDTESIGPVALDSKDLQSDVLVAPRLTVMRSDSCGYGFEGVYLWAGNFYSQRSLPFVADGYATSPPGIYGNEWGPSTDPLEDTSLASASAKLIGSLQSAEFNMRSPLGWGAVKWLAGFRWLQWNETMSIEDSFVDPSTMPPVSGQDFYTTQCFNNLYGGQIGLDAMFWNSGRGMRLEGLVKAGAYGNMAAQNSSYRYGTDGSPFFTNAVSARTGSARGAFVGEAGLTAVFPMVWQSELRIGYTGLWIEGLAQPSKQLSGQQLTQLPPAIGSITTSGGVVLQGLSFGLQKQW